MCSVIDSDPDGGAEAAAVWAVALSANAAHATLAAILMSWIVFTASPVQVVEKNAVLCLARINAEPNLPTQRGLASHVPRLRTWLRRQPQSAGAAPSCRVVEAGVCGAAPPVVARRPVVRG